MKRVEPLYRWSKRALIVQFSLPLVLLIVGFVFINMPDDSAIRQWFFDWLSPYFVYALWAGLFTLIAVQTTLEVLARKRLRTRLIHSRCQLCPSCGYNLRGRARDSVNCPECAYQISRRECVRRWCKLLRTRY